MLDHRFEGHEARAGADEAVETLGHLDASKPLFAAVRIDREHAEGIGEARDVRERLPRADGEWGQNRVDLVLEHGLEEIELVGRALPDRHDLDPRGGKSRL